MADGPATKATEAANPEANPHAEVSASDELRQPMLDLLQRELGDNLVAFELAPGDDLWVRVTRDAWRRTAELCRDRLGLSYFCFLSGIDWRPNPDLLGEKAWEPPEEAAQTEAAGADEVAKVEEARAELEAGEIEAEASGAEVAVVDAEAPGTSTAPAAATVALGATAAPGTSTAAAAATVALGTTAAPGTSTAPAAASRPFPTGVAGGDTRFQVFARLYDVTTHVGLTLKADLDDADPRVDSLVPLYRGADWHEREAWEMYGFTFDGHPGLRHLYLPSEFEGHPLRKDFPLLARLVKPWPGLVDVEPMPGEEAEPGEEAADEG